MATRKTPTLAEARELLRSGRDEEAISVLQALSRAAPPAYEVLLQLGLAYNRIDARQEAVVALKRAAQLQPQAAMPWTGIGIAYGRMGQHARAVDALQTAIRLGDDSGHAHLNLAQALVLVNRAAEAVGIARTACARLPSSDQAAYGRILALQAWAGDSMNTAPEPTRTELDQALKDFLADFKASALVSEAKALQQACATHRQPPVPRPLQAQVIPYLRQAIAEFERLHGEAGSRRAIAPVVLEIGMLLQRGIDAGATEPCHPLQSLPGRNFSGLELTAYLYAGARKLTIAVDFGIDYAAEYELALKNQQG
jgi:tetratricopeptide (TPR) repeat protein